jgi:hypothetical protein
MPRHGCVVPLGAAVVGNLGRRQTVSPFSPRQLPGHQRAGQLLVQAKDLEAAQATEDAVLPQRVKASFLSGSSLLAGLLDSSPSCHSGRDPRRQRPAARAGRPVRQRAGDTPADEPHRAAASGIVLPHKTRRVATPEDFGYWAPFSAFPGMPAPGSAARRTSILRRGARIGFGFPPNSPCSRHGVAPLLLGIASAFGARANRVSTSLVPLLHKLPMLHRTPDQGKALR